MKYQTNTSRGEQNRTVKYLDGGANDGHRHVPLTERQQHQKPREWQNRTNYACPSCRDVLCRWGAYVYACRRCSEGVHEIGQDPQDGDSNTASKDSDSGGGEDLDPDGGENGDKNDRTP